MAQNTWKNKLVTFSDYKFGNEEYLKCQRQAFNSLQLNLSELERYQVVQDFTHCQGKDCGMVLTVLDKDFIDDWNWVGSNEKNYQDIKQKVQIMRENKWNYYIWNCRFCRTRNLLEKNKIFFAKNRSKVIMRDGLKQKDIQSMNQSSLMLFLIDNSSSMEEEIPDIPDPNKIKNNTALNQTLNQMLKKTAIYQKISEIQKNNLNEIKKKVDDAKPETYADFLSKYKIFMSMTEKIVGEICQNKLPSSNNLTNTSNNQSKKIGFMFFNSDIMLQKMMSKDGKKAIRVSDKNDEDRSKDGLKVDFNNFNELYHLGKNNSENYGAQITNFKFSDIQLNNMTPAGQTALGPALAIASGIVSGYAPGSIIVIVTDGKANKGIFTEQGLYEEQIKLLRLRIEKAKAQVCMLKIQNKSLEGEKKEKPKQKQYETCLQRYLRKSASNFCISLEKNLVDEIKNNLTKIFNRQIKSIGFTNEIKIKCQNPAIEYDKNYLTSLKKKVFSKGQKEYIVQQINQTKLGPFDYRHPFMTQVFVSYQNLTTKEESKYVTFLMQKFIKYKQMDKNEQKSFNSMQTLRNVLHYLQAEGQKLSLSNIPLSMCQQSFRSVVMESYRHSERRQMKKDTMLELVNEMSDKSNIKYTTVKGYIGSLIQKPYSNQEQENQDCVKL